MLILIFLYDGITALDAIGHYRGRMTEVARRLGMGRSTLYRKLGELGIGDAACAVAPAKAGAPAGERRGVLHPLGPQPSLG